MIVGKVTIFPREGVNKLNPTRLHQSLQKPTTLKIKNNLLTMLRLASFFVICPLLAAAFTAQGFQRTINPTATANNNNRPPVLHMSTEPGDVNLVVNGNNIDLTPALTDYVEKRIGGPLRKLGGGGIVRECDVHLSVYKNPKVRERSRANSGKIMKSWMLVCFDLPTNQRHLIFQIPIHPSFYSKCTKSHFLSHSVVCNYFLVRFFL